MVRGGLWGLGVVDSHVEMHGGSSVKSLSLRAFTKDWTSGATWDGFTHMHVPTMYNATCSTVKLYTVPEHVHINGAGPSEMLTYVCINITVEGCKWHTITARRECTCHHSGWCDAWLFVLFLFTFVCIRFSLDIINNHSDKSANTNFGYSLHRTIVGALPQPTHCCAPSVLGCQKTHCMW